MNPKEKEEFYRKEVERQTLIILAKKEAQKEVDKLEKIKREKIKREKMMNIYLLKTYYSRVYNSPSAYREKDMDGERVASLLSYNNLTKEHVIIAIEKEQLEKFEKLSIEKKSEIYNKLQEISGSSNQILYDKLCHLQSQSTCGLSILNDYSRILFSLKTRGIFEKEKHEKEIIEKLSTLPMIEEYLSQKKLEYISAGIIFDKNIKSNLYFHMDTYISTNNIKNTINKIFNGYYSDFFMGHFADSHYPKIFEIFVSVFYHPYIKTMINIEELEKQYMMHLSPSTGGIDNPCKRYNYYIFNCEKYFR